MTRGISTWHPRRGRDPPSEYPRGTRGGAATRPRNIREAPAAGSSEYPRGTRDAAKILSVSPSLSQSSEGRYAESPDASFGGAEAQWIENPEQAPDWWRWLGTVLPFELFGADNVHGVRRPSGKALAASFERAAKNDRRKTRAASRGQPPSFINRRRCPSRTWVSDAWT